MVFYGRLGKLNEMLQLRSWGRETCKYYVVYGDIIVGLYRKSWKRKGTVLYGM